MHETPVAASSPIRTKIKAIQRRKPGNSRRSISLFDVSVIDRDISSQKSESNETITSVCKDSGYVRSEGSWLEDDDNKESLKDLVEELKFKDVLISELQESNRGLRLRCADAENKIWRLRVKCESHCGCCQTLPGEENGAEYHEPKCLEARKLNGSTGSLLNHSFNNAIFKRHSLERNKLQLLDNGLGSRNSDVLPTSHRLSGHVKSSLVRSQSSGTIAMQKTTNKKPDHGMANLILAKVKRWQQEVASQVHHSKNTQSRNDNQNQSILTAENSKGFTTIEPSTDTYTPSSYKYKKIRTGKSPRRLTDSLKIVNTRLNSDDGRPSDNDNSTGSSVGSGGSDSENRLTFERLIEARSNLPLRPLNDNNSTILSQSLSSDSFTLSSVTSHSPSPIDFNADLTMNSPNQRHSTDIPPKIQHTTNESVTQTNLNSESDKMTFQSTPESKSSRRQSPCCHSPAQIIIVPCCCKSSSSDSPCHHEKESSCKGVNNYGSSSHNQTPIRRDGPSSPTVNTELLPLFELKRKGSQQLYKEPQHSTNRCSVESDSNTTIIDDRTSGGWIVNLADGSKTKTKWEREIQDRMNKIALESRAENNSLSFKPWPPPDFVETNPLVRCLSETSHFARQIAIGLDKIKRGFAAVSYVNPSF